MSKQIDSKEFAFVKEENRKLRRSLKRDRWIFRGIATAIVIGSVMVAANANQEKK